MWKVHTSGEDGSDVVRRGGAHLDFLLMYPQDTPGVDLIDSDMFEEWPTQIQGVYQPLQHQRSNAEFRRVLSELQFESWSLT